MILIDSTGKLWEVMVSASGQLVTEAIAPQPVLTISDPTGGQWKLGVDSNGVLTTTKI